MDKLEEGLKSVIVFHHRSIPKFTKEVRLSQNTIYSVLHNGINGGSINAVLPTLAKVNINLTLIIKNKIIKVRKENLELVDILYLSAIAAETLIEMIEIEDTHPSLARLMGKHFDAFQLTIEDNSMNRALPDGCCALIDPHEDMKRNGRPFAVRANGYNATIKHIRKLNSGFQLVPGSSNSTHPIKTYNYSESGTETIAIIGRMAYYMLPFDWSF